MNRSNCNLFYENKPLSQYCSWVGSARHQSVHGFSARHFRINCLNLSKNCDVSCPGYFIQRTSNLVKQATGVVVEPRHIAMLYRRRGGQFPPDVFGQLCSLDAPPARRAVFGLQWGH